MVGGSEPAASTALKSSDNTAFTGNIVKLDVQNTLKNQITEQNAEELGTEGDSTLTLHVHYKQYFI